MSKRRLEKIAVSPEDPTLGVIVNPMVICTRTKLVNLPERKLLVDIDEKELDREMRGYWRVTVGYREFAIVQVE